MNSNRERETSLSERTLSGLGCPTFIKALLTLPVLVILARLLTPVDFGLLALAWIFILLGAIAGQSVVGPAIVQRYALTDRHSQVGFTLSVASGIAVMPIIWLLAQLVGEFFNEVHGVRSHNAQTHQCGYCGRTFTCALCDLTPYVYVYCLTVTHLARAAVLPSARNTCILTVSASSATADS